MGPNGDGVEGKMGKSGAGWQVSRLVGWYEPVSRNVYTAQ